MREHMKTYEDCDALFAFVKNLGCDIVQISGIGPITPEEKEELVKKYGFDVCVTHTGFQRMVEDCDAVIAEHKMIDCDCIGIGGMPSENRGSLEGVRAFIADANIVAKKMKEQNCVLSYHNHAFEYEELDGSGGKTTMDILLAETDPEAFFFTPDVAWMHIAGKNPSEELKRMKNRVKVVHFKDYIIDDDINIFCELGNGVVDLDDIYKTCLELNIPYIVYEQDSGFTDSKASTEISFKNLNEIAARN